MLTEVAIADPGKLLQPFTVLFELFELWVELSPKLVLDEVDEKDRPIEEAFVDELELVRDELPELTRC